MADPIPLDERRRERASRRVRRGSVIPDEWPIQFLGSLGEYDFWLDAIGSLKWLRTDRLNNRAVIYRLFGAHWEWLEEHYAKRELQPDGSWAIKPDTLALARLQKHIGQLLEGAGPFDPRYQVRGLGAWRHHDGKHEYLALNFGDGVGFYSGNRHFLSAPRMRDRFVYPRQAVNLTRPDDGPSLTGWPESSFAPWRFQHASLAPKLLAGAVALAPFGALLPVRPVIGIGGIDGHGRGALLGHLGRLLGPWLRRVSGDTDHAIRDALETDSLPVLIEPEPSRPGREGQRRRPDYEGNLLRTASTAVMRFGASELVATPELAPAGLTLRLAAGWPAAGVVTTDDDCAARLPPMLRQVAQRWSWIRHELIPRWWELLADLDGAETDAARVVGTLLAGWWALWCDRLPEAEDLAVLADDLDALMLQEHEQRVPAHLLALRCLLDSLTPERGHTVRRSLMIEAGYDREDEPLVNAGEEYQAIRWARSSETAAKARIANSSLGLRVVGDQPGYREIAIATGLVPARERIERMAGFPPAAVGGGFAELMMAVPGARRITNPIRFESIGRHRAVLIPLYPQIDDAED